jgi:DNA-binding LytR/AlgR family response regulator
MILSEKNIKYEIASYDSGRELIKNIQDMDLVFLDIAMPVMDGIETGKEIFIKKPTCKIIMSTSHVDRFKESFKINAYRFITKPFDPEEINEVFTSYFNQNIGMGEISLFYKRTKYQIQQREIKYVKAYNGYIEAIVKDKVFRKDSSLQAISKELDAGLFAESNSGYYVNLLWVKDYKDGMVIGDDFQIKVPRRKRKEFEEKWVRFDLNRR